MAVHDFLVYEDYKGIINLNPKPQTLNPEVPFQATTVVLLRFGLSRMVSLDLLGVGFRV